MKLGVYAVLDNASGVYDGPVPAATDQVALRNFTEMAKNVESPIGKHPSDFSLWRVGEWNDGTGEITPEVKSCLAYAVDLITPKENN